MAGSLALIPTTKSDAKSQVRYAPLTVGPLWSWTVIQEMI